MLRIIFGSSLLGGLDFLRIFENSPRFKLLLYSYKYELMMFVDTHAHIYLDAFKEDIDETLVRAKEAGITKIFMPNIDLTSVEDMHRLEDDNPEMCFSMIGLHPCSVTMDFQNTLEKLKSYLTKRSYKAIGEIGIDLYWDTSFTKEQIEAFEIQIDWAKEFNLPIVIHSRSSIDLTIETVRRKQDGTLKGVFHCFGDGLEHAKKIIDLGFYMGVGGVLTFKNGGLNKVIKDIPLESMVLETDSPYLAPVPFRGQRNESSYIKNIAERLSEYLNISLEQIAQVTTENARDLFGDF